MVADLHPGWLSLALALFLLAAAYQRFRLLTWVAGTLLIVAGAQFLLGLGTAAATVAWASTLTVLAAIGIPGLRRALTMPLRHMLRDALPGLSATEHHVLDLEATRWENSLYGGKPDWSALLGGAAGDPSPEEGAFLEGPVAEICDALLAERADGSLDELPEAIWRRLVDGGFFGLGIPRSHGGLGFSARAQSDVIRRLASRSQSLAITVMAPHQLGPSELLLRFGTESQRARLLPAIARGEEIPCLAVAGPQAGSDLESMPDEGIVCRLPGAGEQDDDALGLRLNWRKRYVTLAPVATQIIVAVRVRDPNGLLGDAVDRGLTCCLVPADAAGVVIGRRHKPGGAVFMNGPTTGSDVVVPLAAVIGGDAGIGRGRRMLAHCLDHGRSIGLPALATAGAQFALATTGAYARIRRQFGRPVGAFEGVAEVLGRMAGETYRMDAARRYVADLVGRGSRPFVSAAVVKQQTTEGYRRVVNDAMDVHAGKAVIDGPSNYLARIYQAIPIAITVEGSNILTRSQAIFGLGSIVCHPTFRDGLRQRLHGDPEANERVFDRLLLRHVGLFASNLVRAGLLGLTGARIARSPATGALAHAHRQLERLSAAFAASVDVAFLLLGNRLRERDALAGRFADVLAQMVLASATLKRFLDDGEPEADLACARWAIEDSLHRAHLALVGILDNLPGSAAGNMLRWWLMPFGRPWRAPDDALLLEAGSLVQQNGAARERLIGGIHLGTDPDDAAGAVEDAFLKVLAAAPAEAALRNAFNTEVTPLNAAELASRGREAGVITEEQADLLRTAQEAVARAIEVDEFPGHSRSSQQRRKQA